MSWYFLNKSQEREFGTQEEREFSTQKALLKTDIFLIMV